MQNIAHFAMRFDRVAQGHAGIDAINVAPASALFCQHAGSLQIREDLRDGAFGNSDLVRKVADT